LSEANIDGVVAACHRWGNKKGDGLLTAQFANGRLVRYDANSPHRLDVAKFHRERMQDAEEKLKALDKKEAEEKARREEAKPATDAGGSVSSEPSRSSSPAHERHSRSHGGEVHVDGYFRKDGTHVQSHTRSAPGSGGHGGHGRR
jgi:hypothetical protein